MHIRADEINRIAIDRCVSTSGRWMSIFAERYEGRQDKLRGYYIVVVTADTYRIRKIVRIAQDDFLMAKTDWEAWKAKFTQRVDYVQETDAPADFKPVRYSPPFFIEGDLEVLKLKPKHSHIFIREITPVDEVTSRAEQAGLHIVIAEENKPRPTMGIVLALGPDPLLHEELAIGDIVMYSKHAGGTFTEAGEQYRYILLENVIGARRSEDGIEDLIPPNIDPKLLEWAEKIKPTIDIILAQRVGVS